MGLSNYPAGVSDSHPYFNPPREIAVQVECDAVETAVLPSHAVNAVLQELREYVTRQVKAGQNGSEILLGVVGRIERSGLRLGTLEQEREYECEFSGEVEMAESEEAEWQCPDCGATRTKDTLPEQDPDDDRYDEMKDARYGD